MARRLLSIMASMNPHLSMHQQHILLDITTRAVDHLVWHQTVDPQVLRGIVALACPTRNTSSLFTYLIEVIASLTEGDPHDDEDEGYESQSEMDRCENASHSDMDIDLEAGEATPIMVEEESEGDGDSVLQVVVESSVSLQDGGESSLRSASDGQGGGSEAMITESERGETSEETSTSGNWDQLGIFRAQEEDASVVQLLVAHFCMDAVYIAAMPPKVRRAVLESLWGGPHVRELLSKRRRRKYGAGQGPRRPTSPPICSITLEPLLLPNWTIPEDVVAVIHRHPEKRVHAFLYRGRALYSWLSASPAPTNPGTRAWVLPTDIYRLS